MSLFGLGSKYDRSTLSLVLWILISLICSCVVLGHVLFLVLHRFLFLPILFFFFACHVFLFVLLRWFACLLCGDLIKMRVLFFFFFEFVITLIYKSRVE